MGLKETVERAAGLLGKRSIREFEIFGISSDSIRAESKDREVNFLNRSNESGISIRVLVDGSMGFSYGAEADDQLIDAALTSARYQFKDAHNRFPEPGTGYANMDVYDDDTAALSTDDCIEKAVKLEEAARECDPRVEKVRKASFSRSASEVMIMNSHGIRSSFRVTSAGTSLMVTARDGSDVQTGYDFDISHHAADIRVEGVGRSAVERAVSLLGARQIKTMRVPVLFDPSTTAEMLEFISDAFLGENVIKGKSHLRNKLGSKCFSECITISDDPLNERSSDACPFDGEGVPSQRTVLLDRGVLQSFLYDSYWGSAAGKPSTGNSSRSGYRSWPTLSIRHLCLEPSCEPIQGALAVLPQVLKVTDIMGMHTANPITGELSVGINGILLEKGVPAYPVREAALSGNVYEMLSRMISVGDDAREFGHVLCGSLLVDAVDISSQ
jgi:PmbA protein